MFLQHNRLKFQFLGHLKFREKIKKAIGNSVSDYDNRKTKLLYFAKTNQSFHCPKFSTIMPLCKSEISTDCLQFAIHEFSNCQRFCVITRKRCGFDGLIILRTTSKIVE